MKFSDLNLDAAILSAVEEAGFSEPTPIQAETIPTALTGQDVLGQAQTGTGKTAAFGLPVLHKIEVEKHYVQTLVVSPTRELAVQTQEELHRLGRYKKVRVQAVYGGASIGTQIQQLKKNTPHVLVGTPGRLLDHLNRRTLDLSHLQTIVLDEADEMLDMGFVEDIEHILSYIPHEHQTLLFSATMPKAILDIANRFMSNPRIIKIKSKELTADLIDQYYIRSKEFERFDMMTRLFDVQSPKLALIFGRTKRRVDELTHGMQARGYKAEGIHGDLTQQKRLSVLQQFKRGELQFLIATDVAARGLDITGVTHVYNYDIPQDPDSYVHRIGRTGRAGAKGVSVTFVAPNEMDYLRAIENLTRVRMTAMKPATAQEALRGQINRALETVADLAEKDLTAFAEAAQSLSTAYTPEQLAALLLRGLILDNHEVKVRISPERPLPARKMSHTHRDRGGRGGRNSGRRYDHHRNGGDGKKGGDHRNHRSNHESSHGKAKSNPGKKRGFTIRTTSK